MSASAICGDAGWTGVTGCSRNGGPMKDGKEPAGMGLGTNGWIVGGDEQKIAYYTPRISGIQFGAAYIPDHTAEDANGAPNGNNNDGFSASVNLQQDLGEASVAVSAGHYQVSNAASDDQVFSNFGLRVGFGSFGFNVAYAEHEDGDGDAMDSGDYNLTSVGMKYSDGPMAVSLTHMMGDADNGEEAKRHHALPGLHAGAGRRVEDLDHQWRAGHERRHRVRDRHRGRLLIGGLDPDRGRNHTQTVCPAGAAGPG